MSGLFFPLRLLPLEGEWSAWAGLLLWYGGWLSTRISAATLSAAFPNLPSPVSPQASPAHSTHENLCISPLNGSLPLHPSISGRKQPFHFLLPVICVLSGLRCSRLGIPAWGLDPTLLRGIHRLLNYPSGTATCGLPASPLMSPLHSLPVIYCWRWFFSLSKVIRFLSCYCSVVCSGWILQNLLIIPDWSSEEVSVASIYSSAILPGLCFFCN